MNLNVVVSHSCLSRKTEEARDMEQDSSHNCENEVVFGCSRNAEPAEFDVVMQIDAIKQQVVDWYVPHDAGSSVEYASES